MKKTHTSGTFSVMAILVFGSQAIGRAETSPAPSLPLITISSQLQDAVRDLSSEEFKQRAMAMRVLEQATVELASSVLTNTDSEAQLRAAEVMRFNAGLSLWLQATLTMPKETRDAAVTWGLMPEHARWAALAYSPAAENRVLAARKLPEFSEQPARALEALLIEDPDREVRLAAMDAIWDREPTPEGVDALWNAAVAMPIQLFRVHHLPKTDKSLVPPTFRGEPLSPTIAYFTMQNQDTAIDTRVLIHFHSPLVSQQISDLLKQAAASPKDVGVSNLFPVGYASANFETLVDAYKNKSMVPSLYALAIGELGTQRSSVPHQPPLFCSSRLYALGMVVSITGQSLESYGLRRATEIPNLWVVDSSDAELRAVTTLKKWWTIHSAEYGPPTIAPATTASTP